MRFIDIYCYHLLFLLYLQAKRAGEAVDLQRVALEGFEEALGGDHVEVAYAYQALGIMLAVSGQRVEGEEVLALSLDLLLDHLGEDHPDVEYTRGELAVLRGQ